MTEPWRAPELPQKRDKKGNLCGRFNLQKANFMFNLQKSITDKWIVSLKFILHEKKLTFHKREAWRAPVLEGKYTEKALFCCKFNL